jgi:thiamine pyrophosphokinase
MLTSTPILLLNGRPPAALLRCLRAATPVGHVTLTLRLPVENGAAGEDWGRLGPLWAADGGANALPAAELPAACVVGDLDSLEPAARDWHLSHGARLLECPGQDDNDLEKALAQLAAAGHERCWVAGFEGERLDMLLGLGTLLDAAGRPALRLLGEHQILIPLGPGCHEFTALPDEFFSLLAPVPCHLELTGARWGGADLLLGPGCRGVSNRALGGVLTLRVHSGQLLLVRSAPWGDAA